MTKQFSRDELQNIANNVRAACESLRDSGDEYFEGFPRDRCNLACRILGMYLFEQGLSGIIQHVGGVSDARHCWIEAAGIVIDITADQFDDLPRSAVIVTAESAWHRSLADRKIYAVYDAELYEELSTGHRTLARESLSKVKRLLITKHGK